MQKEKDKKMKFSTSVGLIRGSRSKPSREEKKMKSYVKVVRTWWFYSPYCTISAVSDHLGMSRPTVRKYLDMAVEHGDMIMNVEHWRGHAKKHDYRVSDETRKRLENDRFNAYWILQDGKS